MNKLYNLAKKENLDARSKYLRSLILKGLANSKKGHVGSSFSMLEIVRVLYDSFLNTNPKKYNISNRNRLIISPGWAALAQYALLIDKKFIKKKEINNYCNTNAILGGCLDSSTQGVEASTGSCGHGMAIAVGIAKSFKLKKINKIVYVILGDGELGEGSIWESAISASKNKLNNLCIIIDRNYVQCSGFTNEVSKLDPIDQKWKSFGFHVNELNGHSLTDLKKNLAINLKINKKPTVLVCHTIMSKGIKSAENSPDWHWKSGISVDVVNKISTDLK